MANIYDVDGSSKEDWRSFKRNFEAIQNLIDGPDPSKADFLDRGEKLVFKSDRRWVSKKNEILVSQLLSKNASEVGNLLQTLMKLLLQTQT